MKNEMKETKVQPRLLAKLGTKNEVLIYSYLTAIEENGKVDFSVSEISSLFKIKPKTVRKTIQALNEIGVIQTTEGEHGICKGLVFWLKPTEADEARAKEYEEMERYLLSQIEPE